MTKIFMSLDKKTANKWSLLAKQKKLRRLYSGIYTDDFKESDAKIVRSHWMQIVSYIVSNGILSYRTAIDLKPTPFEKDSDIVFLTSSYNKTIKIANLVIKVYKGNYHDYCEQVLPNLTKSNVPRMLLENLSVVRGKKLKGIKTITDNGVEKYLARELRTHGENRINQIRDEAKKIALDLGYKREYEKLYKIISALLSTQDVDFLKTSYAKSIVKKEPYDEKRLEIFSNLSLFLQKCFFKERKYLFSTASFRNLSFFESYFSNFIEGTEFVIDEAEEIVFQGKEINHRHADSHDVLANFYLTNDFIEMNKSPNNSEDFFELLKSRHAFLMKERPEKRPGEFKNKSNKAGGTYFVQPNEVIGTLARGFEIFQMLPEGLPKALFMHYLITEVHPFMDGNGRLSRIMMNAELVKAGLFKIIVPTVCRDNYLGGLRLASRDQFFHTYCKVMDQLQAYTASINWIIYGEAREKIEQDCADKIPDEGLPIFNRALRNLDISILSD